MNDFQIMEVSGIECYEMDGVAYLKLETCARGLGFTEIAASGNECVRWRTVRKYLDDFGIATSCDGDKLPEFIPENIFYRLAMKAKNETAEKFQALVADEIIPSIRKHGAYMTPDTIEKILDDPDTIIRLATSLKEEREKRLALEEKVEEDKPKVVFADAVVTSKTSILIGDLAKLIRQNGVEIGQNRLFKWLRENKYLCSHGERYNMPAQKSMDDGLFEIKETTTVNPDGSIRINRTPKVTGKGQAFFVNLFLSEKQHL